MQRDRKYWLFLLAVCISTFSSAQWISDPCLNSVSTGADFDSSASIRNTAENHTDIVKFQDGAWTGVNSDVINNLSIAPPVTCDASKAAFFRVTNTDTTGQGIGFKLSSPMQQGNQVSFEFTYVSHGYGATSSMQPRLYSSDNGEFFVQGDIDAQLLTNLPEVGNEWETHTFTYTPTGLTAGHEWIYFYAPESSGLLMNMCQIEQGPFEFTVYPLVDMCEGGSVVIGEVFDPALDVDYDWSTGSSEPTIEVSEGGLYTVQASNYCTQASTNFLVVVHDEPNLNIEEDTLLLCEGETANLWGIGLNAQVTWPDGSTDSLFVVTEEGNIEVVISDDCFVVEDEIFVDYDSVPFVDLGEDFSMCPGETTWLDATVPEDVEYEWDNGTTDPMRFVSSQGTYEITLTNECGSYTDAVFVEYSEAPDDILPDITYVCYGRRILIDVSEVEGTYLWQDGSTEPTIWTDYTGYYWVQVIDDDGCFTAADTTLVEQTPCACPVYIPNAFTPDGDGINDEFGVSFYCAPYDYEMVIYNRWGVAIRRLTYPSETWDGRIGGDKIPNGVYGYQVRYSETYDGIPFEVSGFVTVIGADR